MPTTPKTPQISIEVIENKVSLSINAKINTPVELDQFQQLFAQYAVEFRMKRDASYYQNQSEQARKERREKLTKLFMFEKTAPCYALTYHYRTSYGGYKQDRPILFEMIKEGCVKLIHKDAKTKTFQYFPDKDTKKVAAV